MNRTFHPALYEEIIRKYIDPILYIHDNWDKVAKANPYVFSRNCPSPATLYKWFGALERGGPVSDYAARFIRAVFFPKAGWVEFYQKYIYKGVSK